MGRFWTYVQNNSGGAFTLGMPQYLIVEADSADDADDRAQRAGVYFDGCASERDCRCCGDRWTAAYGDGDATPSIYREPIADYEPAFGRMWKHRNGHPVLLARVIYADGRVEEHESPSKREVASE